ncbi:MAG: NDP-sugar synthase [Elusimicrobia bacterium]|nr:NDP-sugar synthase [Candidatus Obscuribacterium magneticum]
MKAILLVGGLATRLRPLTLHRPKGLLPILNIPFLYFQLHRLEKAGVKKAVLAGGHLAEKFKDHFRRHPFGKMTINVIKEPTPRGTGGAIRFAYDHLKKYQESADEPIIIFNGDILFDLDVRKFIRFHKKRGAEGSVALTAVKDPSRFGLVIRDPKSRIRRFIEKPKSHPKKSFINAGAYLLQPHLLEDILPGRTLSIENDLYPRWLKEGKRLYGYSFKGYWNDIGTPASYLKAHLDLCRDKKYWTEMSLLRKRGLPRGGEIYGKKFLSRRQQILVEEKSGIGKKVHLEGMVSVGSHVSIGDSCMIKDAVILDHATIGRGSKISGSIVGHNARLGPKVELQAGSVIGDGSHITAYSKV